MRNCKGTVEDQIGYRPVNMMTYDRPVEGQSFYGD